jgi:peptidoglycan L-alanyl-D-glutamate endopeptidase CwlK
MVYKLGTKSRAALKGVHPLLIKLCEEAIKGAPVDFRVNEGLRSLAQQKINVKKGVSKTLKSKHLTGHAVDIIPLVSGRDSWAWPLYHKLAPHIKRTAKSLGIRVTWGGDWRSFKDGPHWELDPKKYPMPVPVKGKPA